MTGLRRRAARSRGATTGCRERCSLQSTKACRSSTPAPRFEPETVAALAATLAQHAGRLGEGTSRGELRPAVLEFARGPLVLARAGGGDWLAMLARPERDIGPVLYDLRQHGPALAGLL